MGVNKPYTLGTTTLCIDHWVVRLNNIHIYLNDSVCSKRGLRAPFLGSHWSFGGYQYDTWSNFFHWYGILQINITKLRMH